MRPRLWTGVLVFLCALGGCAEEPDCVDEEGEELLSCPQGDLVYCPGDSWGMGDGCNSCACDFDGAVVCTENDCT